VILVVALNPALDVTHQVDGVEWASVNRPSAVHVSPGGKGLNVARILRALGADVCLLGLAGGHTGDVLAAELGAADVRAVLTRIAGETRRTFAVVDTRRDETAIFNEPGPVVSAAEYAGFLDCYAEALPASAAVVLSGSLPRGLPAGTYADLITLAAQAGVPTVLDTSGEALLVGVAAGPAIVKPNLAELLAAVGGGGEWRAGDDRAPVQVAADAAMKLRSRGADTVVVTLGADGMLAVTAEGAWVAGSAPVSGNATGAGDAVAAGLAHGLVHGYPWASRLSHAAALGAAAVAAPVAGQIALSDYERALADVEVKTWERLSCQ
jgi:1-phosphofructokinase family hexose kinase